MMKTIKVIFTTLILMISSLIYGQDFRKTTWGMTKEQVKQTETCEKFVENEDRIIYGDNFAGYDSFLFYNFTEGKLTGGGYSIKEKHSTENKHIKEYKTIKELLEKKYGAPKNDFVKGHLEFVSGHIECFTIWETDKTNIIIGLTRINYKLNTSILYECKELKEFKENKKNFLKDFLNILINFV